MTCCNCNCVDQSAPKWGVKSERWHVWLVNCIKQNNGNPKSRKKNYFWQIKTFSRNRQLLQGGTFIPLWLLRSFVTHCIRWWKRTMIGYPSVPIQNLFKHSNHSCQPKSEKFQTASKKNSKPKSSTVKRYGSSREWWMYYALPCYPMFIINIYKLSSSTSSSSTI